MEKFDIKNNVDSTKENVIVDALHKCLREMYANAQPPGDYDDYLDQYKKGILKKDDKYKFFERHYLSSKEQSYIVDKYLDSYGFKDEFKDHCDVILRYFDDGIIDKYIEKDGDQPGYRGYEHLKPLKEIIGEDAYNKVVERINQAKDFYRFNRDENRFRFNIFDCSPCTNSKTVIEYWKTQDIDLEIKERDDDEIFNRYYYGYDGKDEEEDYYEGVPNPEINEN